MQIATRPVVERSYISGELHAGSAAGQRAVRGGQDHRAVFVAGEIVALRFDAQNIADRAGGHGTGDIGEATGHFLLDEHGGGILEATVPVRAGRDADGRTDEVRCAVEAGHGGLCKLIVEKGIGGPEGDVVSCSGSLNSIRGHIDAAIGYVEARADRAVRAIEIVVRGIDVATDRNDAGIIGKRLRTIDGEGAIDGSRGATADDSVVRRGQTTRAQDRGASVRHLRHACREITARHVVGKTGPGELESRSDRRACEVVGGYAAAERGGYLAGDGSEADDARLAATRSATGGNR